MKKVVFFPLLLVIFISLTWVLVKKFEGTAPVVDIQLPSVYLNRDYDVSILIKDDQSGLKKAVVSIMQAGKEKILLEKEYAKSGISEMMSQSSTKQDHFVIPVQVRKYGMADGDAVIRVMVSDASWRKWNKGNVFYKEENVVIDTQPPQINVLTRRHNIERGGTGLVIYKLHEDNLKTGVRVGDNFFPGHAGMFEDKHIHAAFFALDHMQGPGTQISVEAEDPAGNRTKRGFHHYIRDKRFKTDTLNISDSFLSRKMPDFDMMSGNIKDSGTGQEMVDRFLYINQTLRKENVENLLSIPEKTEATLYWQGRFLRLRGAARRANFADRRIYKYKGRQIDRAVHLGVDLASTANAGVNAANTGRVVFAGYEGIFGNTVIIDHGFGLCSLYSHLSHIEVKKGDLVKKSDRIGTTGLTGLAGGDHLHFSMIVHNKFVNPVEWWDETWIKNNITQKIDEIKKMPDKAS